MSDVFSSFRDTRQMASASREPHEHSGRDRRRERPSKRRRSRSNEQHDDDHRDDGHYASSSKRDYSPSYKKRSQHHNKYEDEDDRRRMKTAYVPGSSHKRRRYSSGEESPPRSHRDQRGEIPRLVSYRDRSPSPRERREKSWSYKHDESHRSRRQRSPSGGSRSPRHSRRSRRSRPRSRLPAGLRSPRDAVVPFLGRSRGPLPSQQDAFKGQGDAGKELGQPVEKQKPNYGASGKLAAETNTVSGTNIVLKYNEPPESRKPPASQGWRIFVFKGKDTVDEIDLWARSCWLFGREKVVADYHIEHPSCSKQHAVVQFRYLEKKNEFGDRIGGVKPYAIDLDSANGTRVNGEKIPASRFYELKSGDVLTFGESSREYVVMLPP